MLKIMGGVWTLFLVLVLGSAGASDPGQCAVEATAVATDRKPITGELTQCTWEDELICNCIYVHIGLGASSACIQLHLKLAVAQ